ncbi:30S ribosomal protein S6 [Candidatus Beckwithbacteria bacterium CG10_big_fil_rev_8_21_14_0_10_34_10]|uniref:Small ribosomal subunit protein bS6 n=1 Tax=Candidatus Beckwithbacteria bacterium CG10_big_fil_rev_8_21_14_0_10_34_10 TaxID=1974495 RepID=A0A2H0WAY8_9BACT|nr:MAG: 30S ribosomal protein S6 [Candidatus Beckwithbacteria bacterium CG10_big_fil_rev_8_21_14_0_10_34_10]
MPDYDLVLILKPSLKPEEEKKELAKVKKMTLDLEGKLGKNESWGKRDLAYPILKNKEAIYHKFKINLPTKAILSWRAKIKLNENIIRYLLIRV